MFGYFYRSAWIILFLLASGCNACSEETASNATGPADTGTGNDVGQDVSIDVFLDDAGGDEVGPLVPPSCTPGIGDCPCQTGQFRLCSSAGDPLTHGDTSLCRNGVQRCWHGEWDEECIGEYTPEDGQCEPETSGEACAGFINERGECVEGPVGDPVDPSVLCEGVENPPLGHPCSCAVPEDGEEFLRKRQPCYTGSIDTLGIGLCRAGWRDCQADGSWGACNDEVTPQAEVCGDGLDNSCNGMVDDGCETCPQGFENCDDVNEGVVTLPCPDGSARNACGGCFEPESSETCAGPGEDAYDNNCNGYVDEGCQCTGSSRRCYPGDPAAAGVGVCAWGIQQCMGEFWGPCVDYVLPTTELCGPDGTGNGQDNNCNGIIDDGCGCTEGATRACGTDTGVCERGLQTCSGGVWSGCQGAIGPSAEVCDGQDNNCNGIVDDGLLNACGTCGEICYTHPTSPAQSGILDEGSEFIEAGDDNNPQNRPGLTLARRSTFPPYLWAANTGQNSVSKFNTTTLEEEGRYWAGLSPSRTAVDLEGNTWVGGRNDGVVTKILWDTTSCPGNNTSTRMGNTVTQVNSATDPLADDCVVYSENPSIGSTLRHNAVRGMAVDPEGTIWVGYSDRNGAIQGIHPTTFQTTDVFIPSAVPLYAPDANGVQQPVMVNGVQQTRAGGMVYGLVGDSQGYIYASGLSRADGLFRFDTRTQQWDAFYSGFDCAVYGVAVDGKDRIWMGCSGPNWGAAADPNGGLAVYDPNTNRATRFFVPHRYQATRPAWGEESEVVMSCPNSTTCAPRFMTTALAVEPATGDIWATVRSFGYIMRLRLDENDLANSRLTYIPVLRDRQSNELLGDLGLGNSPDMRGIGFDPLGYLWHLGMSSTSIFRLNPVNNEREDIHLVGNSGHYTYSDFTGSTAFSFTAPRGFWRYYYDTGFPNAQLDRLRLEAHVPDNTSLGVRVRPLDANNNPLSEWRPADGYFEYPNNANEFAIDLLQNGGSMSGANFEVEVRMTTSDPGGVRPILYELDLDWQRP